MQKWKIKVPIFNSDVIIYLDETLSESISVIEKTYDYKIDFNVPTDNYDEINAFVTQIPSGPIIMVFRIIDVSVIIHECLHAVKRIVFSKGVDDEETECYLMNWLCFQIFNQLKVNIKYDFIKSKKNS